MFTLQRLRILRTVGDQGSFTKAAEKLFYSQPAVSQQIAALEEELGVPLVVRKPRGVTLTHPGRVLFDHAGAILRCVSEAERDLAALAGLEGGELRISSFPTAGAAMMPRAIAQFRQRHPVVNLIFDEVELEESLDRVANGELDLAVVFDYEVAPLDCDPSVTLVPIVEEPLFVALPKSHRLAQRQALTLSQLSGENWIGGNAYYCRKVLEQHCAQQGFEPIIAFESDDYSTVQGLIAEGIGIALLPALATISLLPNVVAKPLRGRVGPRRIYAALPAGDYVLPTAKGMLDILNEVGPETVARSARRLGKPQRRSVTV